MTEFKEAADRVDAGADPLAEARALVERMTLDEKLSCLDGDLPFWPGVTQMAGGYGSRTWPAAKCERLGIPGLEFADGPRGCVIGPSTTFPVPMARGASFDPELEERVGRAIGAELRANGATFTGAVCMNLLRHPAWGRAQETYGEDPHHVGELAAAFTRGLQEHVMACMKHFALNSMENARFSVDVTVDERALHEVYLPHFRRVAEEGVAAVMTAYNSVNGEWCGENRTLMIDILRDEWRWRGLIITDFILGLRDPVKSVHAGLGVEMPFAMQRAAELPAAIERGEVTERDIGERVTETIVTLLRFASVYDAKPDAGVVGSAEHRSLARETATSSIVLLRNEGLLPIDRESLNHVAVLGRLAAMSNLGDAGSSNAANARNPVTPLAGIEQAFGVATVVHSDDATIAADADLTIVVVGYTKHDEGEYLGDAMSNTLMTVAPPMDHPVLGFGDADLSGLSDGIGAGGDGSAEGGDRTTLRLHDADEALIAAAAELSERVVVAIVAGSAVVMPWLDRVPAALMLWYAGVEGGAALADVLCGAEPGGRLPFAVPRDESDLVRFDRDATAETYELLHGQWYLDANDTPAHLPFGHGLSYATMSLGEAVGDDEVVRVEVANGGDRAGSSVVFLYGSVPDSVYDRPPHRLVGFAKVSLDAGESETVEIVPDVRLLDVRFDGGWHTEDAPVAYHVGFDAASLHPVG